ncbi:MAG: AMP-binding protein [Streptosporangiaceae bacterium]
MISLARLAYKAGTIRILVRAGVLRPGRPDRMLRAGYTFARVGPTLAGGVAIAASRHPHATAVIDERGAVTWQELDERTNALARGFGAAGLRADDGIAVFCRNHRGIVESTIAADKLGLTALYLNTMFAAPQIADVCGREAPAALVYDEEFAPAVADAARDLRRFVAWVDDERETSDPTLEELIAAGGRGELPGPRRPGRVVILTSGTTGRPKGARRHQPASLDPVASLFDRIPYRTRETTLVAAPLFHSWGMLNFAFGLSLGSTFVLRRRFDPETVLADVARHRCTALVVVPTMLQRMLDLPKEALARYDTSSLRIVGASGGALPGDLALRVMDQLGDVLYNFYGSTEVAWVAIATPADLRAAPGTAGRPPRDTTVKIVDEAGDELPAGRTGRIFARNEMVFQGYTDGAAKESLGPLMATGDVGHLDEAGRLFIDGRDDDMIVSGGENVFPREVEDLLAGHEHVHDVAVVGVDDPGWGQRLRAYVVAAPRTNPSEDDLKEYVRQRLARYKVPRDVVFVDELPRNATGKIVKRTLG